MHHSIGGIDIDVAEFLQTGLDLKNHLSKYLQLSVDQVQELLPHGSEDLAALHLLVVEQ